MKFEFQEAMCCTLCTPSFLWWWKLMLVALFVVRMLNLKFADLNIGWRQYWRGRLFRSPRAESEKIAAPGLKEISSATSHDESFLCTRSTSRAVTVTISEGIKNVGIRLSWWRFEGLSVIDLAIWVVLGCWCQDDTIGASSDIFSPRSLLPSDVVLLQSLHH